MCNEIIKEVIGLNNQELKTYFTLLNIGAQPASIIASKVNCPRSSIYPTLERMMKKGIVTYFTRRKVRYYNAVGLDKLEDILKDKENHYSAKAKMIGKNRLRLKDYFSVYKDDIKKLSGKPKVQSYLGLEGVNTMWNTFLMQEGNICIYGSLFGCEQERQIWHNFFKKVERIKKIRVLMPKSGEKQKLLAQFMSLSNLEIRFTDLPDIDFVPAATSVCGNLASFISYDDDLLYGVQADDKRLASQLSRLFDYNWEKVKF